MYNGIGLQTPRGSGTNGYIQTNKFFVKPKSTEKEGRGGFEGEQGTAGISKKPNKDILEHDRKRQIHLKLVILEDKLLEQGFTDSEIAEKLDEARKTLERDCNAENSGVPDGALVSVTETKLSDTQSHQIAARKEKQMEILRGALGINAPESNEMEAGELVEDRSRAKNVSREKREHAFLDRDHSWKRNEESKDMSDMPGKKDTKKESDGHKKSKTKKKNDYSSDTDGEMNNQRRQDSQKHQEKISGFGDAKMRKKGKTRSDDSASESSDSEVAEKNKKKERNLSSKEKIHTKRSADGDDFDLKKKEVKKNIVQSVKKSRALNNSESDSSEKLRKKPSSVSNKKKRHDNGSDSSYSDDGSSDSDRDKRVKERFQLARKGRKYERNSESSHTDSSSYSDSDAEKRNKLKVQNVSRKRKYDTDSDFSGSDSDSDSGKLVKGSVSGKKINEPVDFKDKIGKRKQDRFESETFHQGKDSGYKKRKSFQSDDDDDNDDDDSDSSNSQLRNKKGFYGGHGNDKRRDQHDEMERYEPKRDDAVDLVYDRRHNSKFDEVSEKKSSNSQGTRKNDGRKEEKFPIHNDTDKMRDDDSWRREHSTRGDYRYTDSDDRYWSRNETRIPRGGQDRKGEKRERGEDRRSGLLARDDKHDRHGKWREEDIYGRGRERDEQFKSRRSSYNDSSHRSRND